MSSSKNFIEEMVDKVLSNKCSFSFYITLWFDKTIK